MAKVHDAGVNTGEAGKKKALESALHHIEKEFGTGAIMRLGDLGTRMNIEVIPTGSPALDTREAVLLKFTDRNHPVRQHWHFMLSRKRRKKAEWPHLSMRNMLSILFMRTIWA